MISLDDVEHEHAMRPAGQWAPDLLACPRCRRVLRPRDVETGCRFGEPHCAEPLALYLARKHL